MNTKSPLTSTIAVNRESALGSYAELHFSNGLVLAASVVVLGTSCMAAIKAFSIDNTETWPEVLECFMVPGNLLTAADILSSPSSDVLVRWTGCLNKVCIITNRPWVNVQEVLHAQN